MHGRKSVIAKTIQVGISTAFSRVFGVIREALLANYLGSGATADAFFTAFKLPNALRKVFAEGALSASFTPSLVSVIKNGDPEKREASRLMMASLLLFEGIVGILCFLIFFKAAAVIQMIVPGWHSGPSEPFVPTNTAGVIFNFFHKIESTLLPAWYYNWRPDEAAIQAALYLQIMISYIFLLSTSALLAGALQAVDHFFVPAYSPVATNIIFIIGLLICLYAQLPVTIFCLCVLIAGVVQLIMHISTYRHLGFTFTLPDALAIKRLGHIFAKFLPCLLSASVMEFNLFLSTSIASYLPKGSIAMIYYANRFMGIPLGVVAVSFATTLLPHFSRISTYAPKRLAFCLLEAAKIIFWATAPMMLFLASFGREIFMSVFLSKKFSIEQITQSEQILTAFVAGLFFFSLNKIVLNVYYAIHSTWLLTFISIGVTITTGVLSKLILHHLGAPGLALMFTISVGFVQLVLSLLLLRIFGGIKIYVKPFLAFSTNVILQTVSAALFFTLLRLLSPAAWSFLPDFPTLIQLYRYWFLLGIHTSITGLLFYITRRWFGIKLYFLDK